MMMLAAFLVVGLSASAAAQEAPPAGSDKAAKAEAAPGTPAPGTTGVVMAPPPPGQEKIADEGGQIYVNRGYKGVVPGVRDTAAMPSKADGAKDAPASGRPAVEWVGFQPFATYSRVFIQVAGKYTFTVNKVKPDRIEVRLPGADVASFNDMRQLVTREFPTAIDTIKVEAAQGGTDAVVVTISLKQPVGYLYRTDDKYLFVDVER
jgi:hypothetical protein